MNHNRNGNIFHESVITGFDQEKIMLSVIESDEDISPKANQIDPKLLNVKQSQFADSKGEELDSNLMTV